MLKVGSKVKLKEMGLFIAHVLNNKGDDFVGEVVSIENHDDATRYLVKFADDFKGRKHGNCLLLSEECFDVIGYPPVTEKDLIENNVDVNIDGLVKALEGLRDKIEGTKNKPYINIRHLGPEGFLGYIGDATKIIDSNGSVLHVGDIVEIAIGDDSYVTLVGYDNVDDMYVVVGVGAFCKPNGEYHGFGVTKLIDYSIAHKYSKIIDDSIGVDYVVGDSNE